VFGLLEVGFGIGAALGAAMGGYVFDVSGSYKVAFMFGALAMLVATLLFAVVRRRAAASHYQ
jgi:predicted MFS family arabinose efflux permease